MSLWTKLRLLLGLLPQRPLEVYDRVCTVLDVRWDRLRRGPPGKLVPLPPGQALAQLDARLARPTAEFAAEHALEEIEARLRFGAASLSEGAPFALSLNADFSLARLCYLVCRALVPAVVLETGVAYGVTSAFLLQALAMNNRGGLWSVDLPPLAPDADRHVGALIPHGLRARWTLRRGPSRRVLPAVLRELKQVDLFIHDSLHTYRGIRFELTVAWPFLAPGGVVIADDVGDNEAFVEFAAKHASWHCTVREEGKDALFGVMVKGR